MPIDIGDEDALGFELPRPGRGHDAPAPVAYRPAPGPPPEAYRPAPAQPPAPSVPPAPRAPAPPPPAPPVPPSAPATPSVPTAEPEPAPAEPRPAAAVASSWWSPVETPEQFPKPPSTTAPHAPASPEPTVPTWAVRAPAAAQLVHDIVIDPHYLRPRYTVRAGLSSLTVDDECLTLRSMLRKERLPWNQVSGFQPHFPDGEGGPVAKGVLVALTPSGAIELPATRRLSGELRHVHALLDAYRMRAQLYANR